MQKQNAHRQKSILQKYIPEDAVDIVYGWITNHRLQLKITHARKSKQGDYRPPVHHPYHRISINNNLNQYAFLITLMHEMAHLEVWKRYKNSVRPHGKEWKKAFQELMKPFLSESVFPGELLPVIHHHLTKGYASTVSDIQLTRALLNYDGEGSMLVEDIPEMQIFSLHDGRLFRKKNRIRKRYLCYCFNDKKTYLFSPAARVKLHTGK